MRVQVSCLLRIKYLKVSAVDFNLGVLDEPFTKVSPLRHSRKNYSEQSWNFRILDIEIDSITTCLINLKINLV